MGIKNEAKQLEGREADSGEGKQADRKTPAGVVAHIHIPLVFLSFFLFAADLQRCSVQRGHGTVRGALFLRRWDSTS